MDIEQIKEIGSILENMGEETKEGFLWYVGLTVGGEALCTILLFVFGMFTVYWLVRFFSYWARVDTIGGRMLNSMGCSSYDEGCIRQACILLETHKQEQGFTYSQKVKLGKIIPSQLLNNKTEEPESSIVKD